MELTGERRPESPPPKLRGFDSLASLLKAFGEFNLLLDSRGTIVGFGASRKAPLRRLPVSILGRTVNAIADPKLADEIAELTDRTARQGRREKFKCAVTVRGVQRWFSVCAIPLEVHGSRGPALQLEARDVTHDAEATQTLAERKVLFEKAEGAANFGSWEMDLKTNHVKLSAQLMKIYELLPGQEWSRELYWKRMHPSDHTRVRQLVDKSLAECEPVEYVARYCAPDGRVRVHMAQFLPLPGENGNVERAMGVIQDVTDRAESHQELRRLSQQLMNEQDNQRRRLARELHESAGQSLAALKMTLGRLREALPENQQLATSLLDSAACLADGAVREVRTVTYLLHPPLLDDAGLGPALRWYVQGFTERSGIAATIETPELFPRYNQEIETTVFRVVQEALTNVHRYSGSASAEVKLFHDDSKLDVEVRDQGCGFPLALDPSQRRTELGVGISGMRERVRQLDGDFEVKSVPGEGTTVRAVLPARPLNTPAGPDRRTISRAPVILRRKNNAPQTSRGR